MRGPGRRRRGWRALAPACALLAVHVVAQAIAITHDVGTEGHPAGEVCTVCISLGKLGAGHVTTSAPAPAVAATHEAAVSDSALLARAALVAGYRARAPPVASRGRAL